MVRQETIGQGNDMDIANGINASGTSQVQKIFSSPVENDGKDVGQLGPREVKVGQPDLSALTLKNQISDSLTSASCGERAIANFLALAEELGQSIRTKRSEGGDANESLSLKSLLSREINRRAGEWIDSMSTLEKQGFTSDELDMMSHDVVDGLKTLVDRVFEDKVIAETWCASVADESAERTLPPAKASVYRPLAAAALSQKLGRSIPPEKIHVYENIGGGSCFFHAALQQLAKIDPKQYPVGNTRGSANVLRQALINHVRDLQGSMQRGETLGLLAKTEVIGGRNVTDVYAQTSEQADLEHMQPVTEGFDLAHDSSFVRYETMADVSTAAFLADYLQRPVTVIAQTGNGKDSNSASTVEFNYGLVSGQKLSGDPLLIYYDKSAMHFMAVEVDKEG